MLQLLRKIYYKLVERYSCPLCNGTGVDPIFLKAFKEKFTCTGCWKEGPLTREEMLKLYLGKPIFELRGVDTLSFIELMESKRIS